MSRALRMRYALTVVITTISLLVLLQLSYWRGFYDIAALAHAGGAEPQASPQELPLPLDRDLRNARAVAIPEGFVEGEWAPVRPVRPGFRFPLWSPVNPNLIAFRKEGSPGVYLVYLDTGKITRLTDEYADGSRWTADGSYIVYRIRIDERNAVIRMVNVDTGGLTDLSRPARELSLPVERAPGEIVYWIERGEELAQIPTGVTRKLNRPFAFEKNGAVFLRLHGEEKPITSGDGVFNPQVSPDGRKVSYEAAGLFVYNIQEGTTIQIGDSARAEAAAWSPDGEFIAYQQTKGDGHSIHSSSLFVATADGQRVAELSNGPCHRPMHPSWSPDGKALAFECDGAIFVV